MFPARMLLLFLGIPLDDDRYTVETYNMYLGMETRSVHMILYVHSI
jgi:hypothetical protein